MPVYLSAMSSSWPGAHRARIPSAPGAPAGAAARRTPRRAGRRATRAGSPKQKLLDDVEADYESLRERHAAKNERPITKIEKARACSTTSASRASTARACPTAVGAPRCGRERRDRAHGVDGDVAGRLGQRLVLLPPAVAVLRGRSARPRPGRGLREA